MAKLLIDVGHRDNPADPGAVGKVVEYDRNLAIANALRKYVDFDQIPDNTGSLVNTINLINRNYSTSDVLFSIHTNAGGGDGAEVFYFGGNETSRKRAEEGVKLIAQYGDDPIRGAKPDTSSRYGRFGIVRDTKPWAFLIECDFVDDPTGDVVNNVEGYAKGIAKFASLFGFPIRNVDEPTPAPQPQPDPRDRRIEELLANIQSINNEKNAISESLNNFRELSYQWQKKFEELQASSNNQIEKLNERIRVFESKEPEIKEVARELTDEEKTIMANEHLLKNIKKVDNKLKSAIIFNAILGIFIKSKKEEKKG